MKKQSYLSQILSVISPKKERRIIALIYENTIDTKKINTCLIDNTTLDIHIVEANNQMMSSLEQCAKSKSVHIIIVNNLDKELSFEDQQCRVHELDEYLRDYTDVQIVIPMKYNGIYQRYSRSMGFMKHAWLVFKSWSYYKSLFVRDFFCMEKKTWIYIMLVNIFCIIDYYLWEEWKKLMKLLYVWGVKKLCLWHKKRVETTVLFVLHRNMSMEPYREIDLLKILVVELCILRHMNSKMVW